MVWINYDCINQSVPEGTFGGAMCCCSKCTAERHKIKLEREESEKCPCCDGTGKKYVKRKNF